MLVSSSSKTGVFGVFNLNALQNVRKSGLDNFFILHKYIWVLFGKIKKNQTACCDAWHNTLVLYFSSCCCQVDMQSSESSFCCWLRGLLESCIPIWNVSHSRATGNLSNHCTDDRLWKRLVSPPQYFDCLEWDFIIFLLIVTVWEIHMHGRKKHVS